MKIISLLALLLQTLVTSTTQTAQIFALGKVEFKIKNMGLNVTGTMVGVFIQVKQPSANPATWSIEGTADPLTISTGIALRDKHLMKSDYFDVEKYPAIRLQSVSIKPKGKDNYEGTFVLTIKSTRKNIIIPFLIKKNGDSNSMKGEFTINRLDYGLGEKSIILADNVTIKVSALFNSN